MFTTLVINYISLIYKKESHRDMAYVNCNFRDKHTTTATAFFLSILQQLVRRLCYMPTEHKDLFDRYRR